MINEDVFSEFIYTDIHKIQELASSFRAAIMKCDPKSLPITLQAFPRGACGYASLLLSKYFENHGYGQFEYVLGRRKGQSHAWLRRGELIADICADQFNDQNTSIIVTKDHSWHSSFGDIEVHAADFTKYDERTAAILKNAYSLISKQIGP